MIKLLLVIETRFGSSKARRILFMAEAVTLAHVGRLIPIALDRHARGDEVLFAASPRFDALVGALPFPRRKLFSLSSEDFLKSLRRGEFPYSIEILDRYVQDDLEILRDFKPDIVVGDFRLSLLISSVLTNTPYVQIINAYWSPDFNLQYPVPELPIVDRIGSSLSQILFNLVRTSAFRAQTKNLRKVMDKNRVPPPGYDIREFYVKADHVIFTDLREMIPLRENSRPHQTFSGPIHWSPAFSTPDWLSKLARDLPWVCVSLGSSGDPRVLPELLRTLDRMPVRTLLIGDEPPGIGGSARRVASKIVANRDAFELASLVIGNGGSPAAYMALSAGVPFLGIPSNLDQFLMSTCVRHAGVGDYVRAGETVSPILSEKIERLLQDKNVERNVEKFRQVAKIYDPLEAFESVAQRTAR